jgi:hypothetical protein
LEKNNYHECKTCGNCEHSILLSVPDEDGEWQDGWFCALDSTPPCPRGSFSGSTDDLAREMATLVAERMAWERDHEVVPNGTCDKWEPLHDEDDKDMTHLN